MSCIKFPTSKSEVKAQSNDNVSSPPLTESQLISVANDTYLTGNWSHAITNQTLDFVDYISGKYYAGCTCIVRVEINNQGKINFHESVGFSYAEGSSKGSAVQKVRIGSYQDAFKKALLCFGSIKEKIKKLQNSSENPQVLESLKKNVPLKENLPTVPNQNEYDSTVPLSQTDAFMDCVDIDQFNVTKVKPAIIEVKTSSTSIGEKTSNKEQSSTKILNTMETNTKVLGEIATANTKGAEKTNNNNNNVKNDNVNFQKPIIHTAMTEEEARLERKRKQKEMQEEFKKKQELKKACNINLAKQSPNPRY